MTASSALEMSITDRLENALKSSSPGFRAYILRHFLAASMFVCSSSCLLPVVRPWNGPPLILIANNPQRPSHRPHSPSPEIDLQFVMFTCGLQVTAKMKPGDLHSMLVLLNGKAPIYWFKHSFYRQDLWVRPVSRQKPLRIL